MNQAGQYIMLAVGITLLMILYDRAAKLGAILLGLIVLGLLMTAQKKGII